MTDNPAGQPSGIDPDVSGDFEPADYSIDPADQHIADEIRSMDMITDVPGPVTTKGDVKVPEPTLKALPPNLRDEIEAQLARTPVSQRAETERELITKALRKQSSYVRSLAGVGEGATPYHKEMASIARDVRTAEAEFDQISDQLVAISHYESAWDEEKQERVPVPVYVHNGAARQGLINRQSELLYKINLLANPDGTLGFEGRRRADKALAESVALRKAVAEQKADMEAVETRAQELAREDRIERKAKVRAKMLDKDFHA